MKLYKRMRKGIYGLLLCSLLVCAGSQSAAAYKYNKEGKKAKKAAGNQEVHLDEGTEYHAYMLLTVQESWVFRGRFFEKGQGTDYKHFDKLVTSLNVSEPKPLGGKFEDAVISGNGHYTVKLTGINGMLSEGSNSAALAILGFTTDIPYDQGIAINNVKVMMDGMDKGMQSGEDVYYDKDDKEDPGLITVELVNVWHEECQNPLNLALAQDSIEISFDVTGFSYVNPNVARQIDEEPVQTTTVDDSIDDTTDDAGVSDQAADNTETPDQTAAGNENGSSIPVWPIVGAVVVVIVIIAIVMMVRKKNKYNEN